MGWSMGKGLDKLMFHQDISLGTPLTAVHPDVHTDGVCGVYNILVSISRKLCVVRGVPTKSDSGTGTTDAFIKI